MDGAFGGEDKARSLIEVARQLAPRIAARTDEARALRRVPDETIADLRASSLFRAVKPTRFGGLELDPVVLYRVQVELGRACGSTAWVFGVLSVHTWQLALFPDEAQQEVWGRDPDALIASSYMPVGRVTREGGEVRLSGRWSFSSGIDHSDWVMLGGFLPAEDGRAPEMCTFLVPKSDCTVVDTWFVTGLVASGSKDVVVEGARVPAHRIHRFADGFRQDSPGNAWNPSPVYRYPFGQIHVRCVSTPALGVALGAVDAARALADEVTDPVERLRLREAIATASARIDRELLALERDFGEMADLIGRGAPIPLERRARNRHDAARAVGEAIAAVDALFTAAGLRALRGDHPLNRAFQDVHAIRAHHANGPDGPTRNLGGVLLGERTTDYFL